MLQEGKKNLGRKPQLICPTWWPGQALDRWLSWPRRRQLTGWEGPHRGRGAGVPGVQRRGETLPSTQRRAADAPWPTAQAQRPAGAVVLLGRADGIASWVPSRLLESPMAREVPRRGDGGESPKCLLPRYQPFSSHLPGGSGLIAKRAAI